MKTTQLLNFDIWTCLSPSMSKHIRRSWIPHSVPSVVDAYNPFYSFNKLKYQETWTENVLWITFTKERKIKKQASAVLETMQGLKLKSRLRWMPLLFSWPMSPQLVIIDHLSWNTQQAYLKDIIEFIKKCEENWSNFIVVDEFKQHFSMIKQ